MPEYGMETCDMAHQRKVQNSTISRESDVDTFIDSHVSTLEHCQDKDTTVNSASYTDTQNITFCD
jgi:hypothetical protein